MELPHNNCTLNDIAEMFMTVIKCNSFMFVISTMHQMMYKIFKSYLTFINTLPMSTHTIHCISL